MLDNIEFQPRPHIGEEKNVYGIYAIKDGHFVGHIYGCLNPDKTAILESLVIDTSERQKGIGTSLLTKFIECMIQEGVFEIIGHMSPEYGLHVSETKRFYEKNGFQVDNNLNFKRTL